MLLFHRSHIESQGLDDLKNLMPTPVLLWLKNGPPKAQQAKKDSILPGQAGSVGNNTILMNELHSSEEERDGLGI